MSRNLTKKERKEKANHNLNTSIFLHTSEENFDDWVITTSFYSSIHFVDYLIFPVKIMSGNKKLNFTSLDGLYNYYKNNSDARRPQSKHVFRKELVILFMGSGLGGFFKTLQEECFNARYKFYPIDCNAGQFLSIAKSIKSYIESTSKLKEVKMDTILKL